MTLPLRIWRINELDKSLSSERERASKLEGDIRRREVETTEMKERMVEAVNARRQIYRGHKRLQDKTRFTHKSYRRMNEKIAPVDASVSQKYGGRGEETAVAIQKHLSRFAEECGNTLQGFVDNTRGKVTFRRHDLGGYYHPSWFAGGKARLTDVSSLRPPRPHGNDVSNVPRVCGSSPGVRAGVDRGDVEAPLLTRPIAIGVPTTQRSLPPRTCCNNKKQDFC